MKLAVALVLAAGTARADVHVDWAAGLVTAEGVGVADRHAPSPAVARGTSRRVAEDAARAELRGKLAELPWAAGGKVAEHLKNLDVVLAHAFATRAEPQTDGAWRVTLAVPIEALRQAVPRALPVAGDSGPPIVVIDGAKAKPAVGWTIGGISAATIWVAKVPAWAKDAPHANATKAAAGAIELERAIGTPSTLFIVVQP